MFATLANRGPSSRPVGNSAAAPEPVAALRLPENIGRNVAVERDEVIFWEGDQATSYYRVVSGAVRICKLMADGRRQVADFFTAGDLVVLDLAQLYSFTAEAVVDSVVREYSRSSIMNLLTSDQQFSRQLLAITCRRLMSAHHQMVTLGRKTAEERIATFLSGLADRKPKRTLPIELPSRSDIADYLGLTVETVSRVLAKLKRQGVIELPNTHSVTVVDPDALDLLVEGAA
jgi:CRP-like cAMP-binding protein